MVELQKARVGDIALMTKLNISQNSDTLAKNENIEQLPLIKFPKEQMLIAIRAQK